MGKCLGGSMKENKIKIDILPNYFLKEDGTFNLGEAVKLCGKIAGVCYDKEGFFHLVNESIEVTQKRVDMTLDNGHHSVYDHIMINFNIQKLPKILAMIINNEHEYTTSEKSARYTPIVSSKVNYSAISETEEELYNKWNQILREKIKEKYGYIYNDAKIKKLAQENARYFVTVFVPTEMIYSTTVRQINYLASWMAKYMCDVANSKDEFEKELAFAMSEFIAELDRLNVLEPRLMKNEKHRSLSLFGKDLDQVEEYFGNVYATVYKASFAELAQAQRHRTLDYQMEILGDKEYFVPPIIMDDEALVSEWLSDMKRVENIYPQGELVKVSEMGKYEDFILKCKERLCSAAQLEIMMQTRDTLLKYKEGLEKSGHPLANDIVKYSRGARCTFPDFDCSSDCKKKKKKTLTRKI